MEMADTCDAMPSQRELHYCVTIIDSDIPDDVDVDVFVASAEWPCRG